MEETVTLIKLPCKPTIHTIKDKAEEVQDSKKCPFGIANSNAMKFMMILKYPARQKKNWYFKSHRLLG